MKKIIILVLFCFSTLSLAGEARYPFIMLSSADQQEVTVTKCWTVEICGTIGVYPMDSFDSRPGIRKLKAVGTGVGEVVVMVITSWIAGIIGIGTRSDLNVTISMIAVAGSELAAVLLIKPINPFYQWSLANIEAATQQEDLKRGPIIIECKDDFEMAKIEAKIRALHE